MPVVSALQQYVNDCVAALREIDLTKVDQLVRAMLATRDTGNTVFLAGNGGSAATATHMATDLMLTSRLENPPLRVVALTDNQAIITATANDISYDDVFARQLRTLGRAGDLLVLVSASGNSPNLLCAADEARRMGIGTASLTGFDGGRLAEATEIAVHVPTPIGAYGVSEDAHLVINHMITECLKTCS